jgi:integrase
MSRTNVHGLPAHLRKDGQGYFLDFFVQENGISKRKRERLGQIPLAQAKLILAQNHRAILEQKFMAPEKPKVMFSAAAESFLAYSRSRKRTFRSDELTVGRLKAFFGDRPLDSFSPDLVEAYLVHRRENTQGRNGVIKGASLNRDVACLKTICRRAVLNRLIDRNPVEGVKKFKEEYRSRTLEPEEYLRLLEHCGLHLRNIIQFAYVTGMRRGEILGLRWDQVDFKNKLILLQATDTKTQEKREVPLDDELVELLKRVPRVIGCPNVFTFRGKPIKDVKSAFYLAMGKAGISNFRFHDLRHCAITNLRKAGVSDSVIMSISGHKTAAVFRKYDRVDREDRQLAVQRVRGLIDISLTRAQKPDELKVEGGA